MNTPNAPSTMTAPKRVQSFFVDIEGERPSLTADWERAEHEVFDLLPLYEWARPAIRTVLHDANVHGGWALHELEVGVEIVSTDARDDPDAGLQEVHARTLSRHDDVGRPGHARILVTYRTSFNVYEKTIEVPLTELERDE